MSSANLFWTGHALVDVGIAGVCAFTSQRRPEATRPQDLTLQDLDAVSDFMIENYYEAKLGTYLSCVFMNASFVQPNEGAAKRQEFIERYLRAHRSEIDLTVAGKKCVFSGLPATAPLVRTHLPMFSGEGVVNFRPDGTTFVPVAGAFIVCLMFLPLASRRAEGKLLCVHAEEPALTLTFARRHLEDNQRLIALALPSARAPTHEGYDRELPAWDAPKKRYKFADVKGPRSLLIADLTEIGLRTTDFYSRLSPLSVYLLSNSGQGPSLDMFDVPGGVVSFVLKASGATTGGAWAAISRRFRSLKDGAGENENVDAPQTLARKPGKRGAAVAVGRPGWSKNPAFEELCAIYDCGFLDREKAEDWLSRYLLGRLKPHRGESRFETTDARTWALAELFLREVLGMKQGRIDAIRAFADKLAGWIQSKRDKSAYRSLMIDKPNDLRQSLMRIQKTSAEGGEILFGLDEYATVWLHEDGDEWLVRDLICIRVVETLALKGFFSVNSGLLPEELQRTEVTA